MQPGLGRDSWIRASKQVGRQDPGGAASARLAVAFHPRVSMLFCPKYTHTSPYACFPRERGGTIRNPSPG